MTHSAPKRSAWCQPLWTVAAAGLTLAALVAGCLNSPRVPDHAGTRSVRQPPNASHTQSTPAALHTVPRAWLPAKPPRRWDSIVLHHTATEAGSVASIHANHLGRKTNGQPWLGIGYHFVIGNGKGMPDGSVQPTFRWRDQLHGAHAGDQAHNQHGIGIALIGNFQNQTPTTKQLDSLRRLIQYLLTTHSVPTNQILGHRDIKATACPGKLFPLETLKNRNWGQNLKSE